MQFDREREPWWAVQDAGLDIVALCDTGGTPSGEFPSGTARVVAQFGYDAYGSVVTAETLFAHALLRAGHKGLFFDRLDLGVADPFSLEETPRLAVGADLLGYARNRVYSPRLGRWVQRDPNGVVGLIIGDQARHGRAWRPSLEHELDLDQHYADGADSYLYLAAQPLGASDPLGLFVMSPFDTLMTGMEIGAALYRVTALYADNQYGVLEWATDWTLGDDFLSPGANLSGVSRHDLVEEDPLDEDGLDESEMEMAGGAGGYRAIKAFIALRKWRFGQVFDSYSLARQAKAGMGLGHRAQAHHIVPKAICEAIGIGSNGPAVILGKKHHQVLHRSINRVISECQGMKRNGVNPEDVAAHARRQLTQIYARYPEWVEAVARTLP